MPVTFKKYLFPPIFGLVVYFTIRLILDSVTGMKFWHRPWQINSIEIGACLVYSYLFMAAFERLLRYFDTRWPTTDLSNRRVMLELLYVFLLNLIFQNALLVPLAAFTDDGLEWYDLVDLNTIPMLYSMIYYGMRRSRTFLKAYIQGKVQLEKIRNDQLQTELKFLKAQFHPHFLFNALNTIYFQMDEDTAAAKKSVEKFSELLRYQLYHQQQTVPISEEIRYLQNFIQLQSIRSSEKLQLSVSFDPALNGQQVYPLLLLPLVENAFKYVGGAYWLSIAIQMTGTALHFRVSNATPLEIPPQKAGGIGLENLRRRLQLLYPDKHELIIEKKNDSFHAALTLSISSSQQSIAI